MEASLFVFAVALALLVLCWPSTGYLRLPAAAVLAAAVLGACWWNAHTQADRAAASAWSAHVPATAREGFASSDACRSCHPGAYASWAASFHRTMTQPPTAAAVRAPFDGRTLEVHGHTYRFRQVGKTFVVDVDGAPRDVALVTGSHHQQRYWLRSEAGRAVDLLPLDFLLADARWVPGESVFLMPPGVGEADAAGLWNHNCITCHSVAGQPGIDASGAEPDTRVAELGIACEACHGGAAAHAARFRDPLRRYAAHLAGDDADAAIVNPGRLAARDASAVCGQCHAVFVFKQPRRWRREGATYHPGGALEDDRFMVPATGGADAAAAHPPYPPGFLAQRFWPDGEVRVSGREYSGLVASACYQRGELSCLSCHSMHSSSPDDQLRRDRQGDAACLSCHAAARYAGPTHTHHAAASDGSRCMNCHMPYTTYGLLKAIRTHRISSPNVATGMATGRPNGCNLCHLDRTAAWTATHLTEWYGQAAVALTGEDRDVAAGLVWLLRGDAGQRALAAASMGWPPAQAAAGTAWMPPFLAAVLDDPYSAVRYSAARALRSLDGYAGIEYDHVGAPAGWQRAQNDVLHRWQTARNSGAVARPELLFDATGRLNRAAFDTLRHERDDRAVALSE